MVKVKNGAEHLEEVRRLFREYSCIEGAERCFISFENELKELPGVYAEPAGAIRLAFMGGKAVGCAAFKPVDKSTCEIKRLFVLEEYRSNGIGEVLIKDILNLAFKKYEIVQLETLPIMTSAIRIYERNGFLKVGIEDGVILMKKIRNLKKEESRRRK